MLRFNPWGLVPEGHAGPRENPFQVLPGSGDDNFGAASVANPGSEVTAPLLIHRMPMAGASGSGDSDLVEFRSAPPQAAPLVEEEALGTEGALPRGAAAHAEATGEDPSRPRSEALGGGPSELRESGTTAVLEGG